MTNPNLQKWLALKNIPRLGDATIKKLWDHFGSIDLILNADIRELSKIDGLTEKVALSIAHIYDPSTFGRGRVPEIIFNHKLGEGDRINVFTFDSPEYPSNLKNITDPPPLLYARGELLDSDNKAIAIVGTRNASSYGLSVAHTLASDLAKLGVTIVSGMALGIDTASHKGALSAGGRTLAVLACGPNVIYPPENRELSELIIQSGAIVSEFPPDELPDNWKFPRRNRIISGLSLGVIVVEGGYKSGAMITAKLAIDEGREVFAVPGDIRNQNAQGPHWLIKQGGKLVENVDDILNEINDLRISMVRQAHHDGCCHPEPVEGRQWQQPQTEINIETLSEDEQVVFKEISSTPIHIDDLSSVTNFNIQKLMSILSQLEIKNAIKQTPGKYFILQ